MGYEKFIIDADQANMIAVLLNGIDTSENGQALGALREIGPGAHFLGAAHTQTNFETAFYRSEIADNNSFEQWEEEGRMLRDYEPPAIDPGVDEALREFISRRKAEFPDKDY